MPLHDRICTCLQDHIVYFVVDEYEEKGDVCSQTDPPWNVPPNDVWLGTHSISYS